MSKRVLAITNEALSYSGIVPANTLAGITEDFNYVTNMVEIAKEISGFDVVELHYHELSAEAVARIAPDYIIAGGHCSMDGWGDMDFLRKEYAAECEIVRTTQIPYLGICAGHQFLCMAYGLDIAPMGDGSVEVAEYGPAKVHVVENDPLFADMPDPFLAMMYHSWEVKGTNSELKILGSTDLCRCSVVRHINRPVYGVQFHPEMLQCADVRDGRQLLKNFFSL